jgi:hypothetical protein
LMKLNLHGTDNTSLIWNPWLSNSGLSKLNRDQQSIASFNERMWIMIFTIPSEKHNINSVVIKSVTNFMKQNPSSEATSHLLMKKLTAFTGTWSFITMPWARWIHSHTYTPFLWVPFSYFHPYILAFLVASFCPAF